MLKHLAGENVDEYMNGTKRILGVKHAHSAAAYRMLEKYAVDNCYKVCCFGHNVFVLYVINFSRSKKYFNE